MIRSEGEIKTQILNVTSMNWISADFFKIEGKFNGAVVFPSENGNYVTFMGTPKGDNKKKTLIYQVCTVKSCNYESRNTDMSRKYNRLLVAVPIENSSYNDNLIIILVLLLIEDYHYY